EVGRVGLRGTEGWGRPALSGPRANRRRMRGESKGVAALFVAVLSVHVFAAEHGRQIVDEAQKRTQASSQRYEGLLQVFDNRGKISDKRWTLERLGSHGQ